MPTYFIMMTSSNRNIYRVTGLFVGEFTGCRWILRTRSVTRSFDVFFDLRLNKPLSKQSRGRWSETPSRPLWRHCNVESTFGEQDLHNSWYVSWHNWKCFSLLIIMFIHIYATVWPCCILVQQTRKYFAWKICKLLIRIKPDYQSQRIRGLD